MKINNDGRMVLECSGRFVSSDDIGISPYTETSDAINGCEDGRGVPALAISVDARLPVRAWTSFDNHATDVEKRELAVHMMRRWAKYGGICTITVADADVAGVTHVVFALDLDNEKA